MQIVQKLTTLWMQFLCKRKYKTFNCIGNVCKIFDSLCVIEDYTCFLASDFSFPLSPFLEFDNVFGVKSWKNRKSNLVFCAKFRLNMLMLVIKFP